MTERVRGSTGDKLADAILSVQGWLTHAIAAVFEAQDAKRTGRLKDTSTAIWAVPFVVRCGHAQQNARRTQGRARRAVGGFGNPASVFPGHFHVPDSSAWVHLGPPGSGEQSVAIRDVYVVMEAIDMTARVECDHRRGPASSSNAPALLLAGPFRPMQWPLAEPRQTLSKRVVP